VKAKDQLQTLWLMKDFTRIFTANVLSPLTHPRFNGYFPDSLLIASCSQIGTISRKIQKNTTITTRTTIFYF